MAPLKMPPRGDQPANIDPSLLLCSIRDSFLPPLEVENPVSYQEFRDQGGEGETPLPEKVYDLPSPFSLPLRDFTQKEALLLADIDATFRLTDLMPPVMWAFPTHSYPARQAFSVGYLTPRLIGNYNFANWNSPGVEYIAYRRPEYFQFAFVPGKSILGGTPLDRTFLFLDEAARPHDDPPPFLGGRGNLEEFIREVRKVQVDGLQLVISWGDLRKSLILALKTLRIGGDCLIRVEEDPGLEWLCVAGRGFDRMWLFKPFLSNPFTKERFLVLKGKRPGLSEELRTLEEGVGFPVDQSISSWLTHENNNLARYQDKIARGDYLPVSPSKCFVKWNLPDLPPPTNIVCFPREKSVDRLEGDDGSAEPVIDSSQWSRRTNALAIVPKDGIHNVYLAKPFYLGGWIWVGASASDDRELLEKESVYPRPLLEPRCYMVDSSPTRPAV